MANGKLSTESILPPVDGSEGRRLTWPFMTVVVLVIGVAIAGLQTSPKAPLRFDRKSREVCTVCHHMGCSLQTCDATQRRNREAARVALVHTATPATRSFEPLLQALCCNTDQAFLRHFWGQAPLLLPVHVATNWLTIEDLQAAADAEPLEWATSEPESAHFTATLKDAKGGYGVSRSVKAGTAIFNQFSLHSRKVGELSSQFTRALQMPCVANVYATGGGHNVSAQPHNDMQDVVIIQTHGRKRWRVWPPPNQVYRPHIFHMEGKSGDKAIHTEALGMPLLDMVLEPGQMLYVPRGFVHTTSTPLGEVETSVHVTMNLETSVVRQTYDALMVCACGLMTEALDDVNEDTFAQLWDLIDSSNVTRVREELPFGFLAGQHLGNTNLSHWQSSTFLRRTVVARVREIMAKELYLEIGLKEKHFLAEPFAPHLKPIDMMLESLVDRFIQAHMEYLSIYDLDFESWHARPALERKQFFDENVQKQPSRELFMECGEGLQPGGKYQMYSGMA